MPQLYIQSGFQPSRLRLGIVQTIASLTLAESEWRCLEDTHQSRATQLTEPHLVRRQRGEKHPVEDFLFTYYNLKPAQLKRWHPGAGVTLEGDTVDRLAWKDYRPVEHPMTAQFAREHSGTTKAAGGLGLMVDAAAFMARRGTMVDFVEDLLSQTLTRAPSLGCFGLHEWAMVYRLTPEEIRHRGLPLRLTPAETDFVVETNPIACSHFDAFRFFTPEAKPLNLLQPSREKQPEMEQAGCLHAGMDIYKWTMKLGPLAPGELLLDTFELAMEIRRVDMQASPYDVSQFGLAPIPIETVEGKSTYASLQREFMERGNKLRLRVLDAISAARASASASA